MFLCVPVKNEQEKLPVLETVYYIKQIRHINNLHNGTVLHYAKMGTSKTNTEKSILRAMNKPLCFLSISQRSL